MPAKETSSVTASSTPGTAEEAPRKAVGEAPRKAVGEAAGEAASIRPSQPHAAQGSTKPRSSHGFQRGYRSAWTRIHWLPFCWLVWKELLLEGRGFARAVGMLGFALLILLIFHLTLAASEGTVGYLYGEDVARRWSAAERDTHAAGLAALISLKGERFATRAAFVLALQRLQHALPPERRLPDRLLARVVQGSALSAAQRRAAGIFWATFLLAGTLALARTFEPEFQHEALRGILMTPVWRGAIYLAKWLVLSLSLTFFAALLWLALTLFFQPRLLGDPWTLSAALAGGILGFTALGTLLAALTAETRGRDLLLPLLFFPLLTPILLLSVQLTDSILGGATLLERGTWLLLLLGLDGIFLLLGLLLFEIVLEG